MKQFFRNKLALIGLCLVSAMAFAVVSERHITYKLKPALQGGTVADAEDVGLQQTYPGVVSGSTQVEQAISRLDGTGVGAAIFRFTGSYAAQNSNINEWFGGRQLNRLRCTSAGGLVPATFTLPGSTALNAAFDQLVGAGLPEVLIFVLEYTGDASSFLSVQPRAGGPTLQGTSSIPVRSGIAASVEVTRSGGVISNYVFDAIGVISGADSGVFDALKFIDPADAVWNASDTGNLPSVGVVKGNGYRITGVPAGSDTVLDEVMANGDYAVWTGASFTSWTATPHQWIVLPAHEVRRISALEQDFLTGVAESPRSDRNGVARGADYADSAGEIRLKIYPTAGDYSAADLNTTGDIDAYTDASDQAGVLAVRFSGTQSSLAAVLPTLYAYVEHQDGSFTRLGNLEDDFLYQGDFGAESDYLSAAPINYSAGDTIRIYLGSVLDRFTNPNFDVTEAMLTPDVQAKLNRSGGGGAVDDQRLAAVESKVATLYPLAPDVTDLTDWASIFDPERSAQAVEIADGYSLIADYRGPGTRYESAGVTYSDAGSNVVTYSGLGDNLYRTFGFKVDGPADQVLLWIVDGADRIPYVDMTTAGNFRINDYTPATTEDQTVSDRPIPQTRTAGDEILTRGSGNVSTFPMANFPAGASQTSRSVDFDVDIYVNGVDSQAGDLVNVPLPAANTAAARASITRDVYLGPLHGNRTVRVELGYTLRVSGADLLVDFSLLNAPSDVTVRIDSVYTYLSYTAPSTVARVDNFITLNDEGGAYSFSGESELLLTFHPFQNLGIMNVVPAAVTGGTVTELNDDDTPIPAHRFASVEVPDTTALSGFEFRTFSPEHFLLHSDLSHLLSRRATQWSYGLALLRAITEHAITEPIDLAAGTTLDGAAIGGNLAPLAVHQATAVGTGSGELVASVALPANYTSYDFVHITDVTPGSPNVWRHAVISTALLSSGHLGANDNIRLPDSTVLSWTLGTRTISVSGGAQEIYSVTLVDN